MITYKHFRYLLGGVLSFLLGSAVHANVLVDEFDQVGDDLQRVRRLQTPTTSTANEVSEETIVPSPPSNGPKESIASKTSATKKTITFPSPEELGIQFELPLTASPSKTPLPKPTVKPEGDRKKKNASSKISSSSTTSNTSPSSNSITTDDGTTFNDDSLNTNDKDDDGLAADDDVDVIIDKTITNNSTKVADGAVEEPSETELRTTYTKPLTSSSSSFHFPKERDQPKFWPETVASIFVVVSLCLFGITAYKNYKKRGSYQKITDSLTV